MSGRTTRVLACLAGLAVGAASAADYRSVGEGPAVAVDAPSARGKKVYVYSAGYPLEVIIQLDGWTKVRDAAGEFAWVEDKAFGERRTVLVRLSIAEVRQAPEDSAPVAFQAEQNVVLELLEQPVPGWVKVRLRDGQTGFIKLSQIWGA
ncbi:MAG: SH3 domain-containing protein [Xanthobacteraceae bacterium]